MEKSTHFRLNFSLSREDPAEKDCHDFLSKVGTRWLVPDLKKFVIASAKKKINELSALSEERRSSDVSGAAPKEQVEASSQPSLSLHPLRQDSPKRPVHPQDIARRLENIKRGLCNLPPDLASEIMEQHRKRLESGETDILPKYVVERLAQRRDMEKRKNGVQILDEHG